MDFLCYFGEFPKCEFNLGLECLTYTRETWELEGRLEMGILPMERSNTPRCS